VSFIASVSPSSATGAVMFFDGTAALGSGTLNKGQATFSTATLNSGTHSMTARYGGDSNYSGSTSLALAQVVNAAKVNTTTTLTSNPLPGGVALTAKVSPSGATGTVTFLESGAVIGSASLNQPSVGKAGLTGALLPGTHSITASYGGDSTYNGSASTAIVLTGTTTSLISSSNPSTLGQSIVFTATVSPGNAIGAVTFNANGGTILCVESGTLINGQVKCTAHLLAGTFSITAVYSGDNNNSGSSSAPLTQVVNAK
jgi:hypothetical protein